MNYPSRSAGDASLATPTDFAPVIVAGSSAAARARGVAQVEAGGFRLGDCVSIEGAGERLSRQARASAVWIELDCDEGAPLDSLLYRVDRDASAGRYAAIVAAPPSMLDVVSARLGGGHVDLLIDDDDVRDIVPRVSALALALSRPMGRSRARDVARDGSAARLRQLTDEVGRIAAKLAELSGGPEPSSTGGGTIGALPPPATGFKPDANVPPVSQEVVRNVIRARRLRSRYFSEELFADPAWDMLLDLTCAELAQVRVPVSSLCIAAAVPATTALRWIKTLTDNGLLLRRADPHDGRRVFIEMTPTTSSAMMRYFAEVATPAGA